MRTTRWKVLLGASAVAAAAGCATYPDEAQTRAEAERILRASFSAPAPELLERLEQDRAQQICSKIGGAALTEQEAARTVELARESMRYPASGKLVGNWKIGEKLAHDGAGDRIARGQLEKRKENGGLCQNCHALAPGEINVGNVGPALTGYGAERGSSAAIAKITYEKIYNNWAYYPCSNMPRLGATGHLTPEQITHLVEYLIDPQSPLNRTRKP